MVLAMAEEEDTKWFASNDISILDLVDWELDEDGDIKYDNDLMDQEEYIMLINRILGRRKDDDA